MAFSKLLDKPFILFPFHLSFSFRLSVGYKIVSFSILDKAFMPCQFAMDNTDPSNPPFPEEKRDKRPCKLCGEGGRRGVGASGRLFFVDVENLWFDH
jgi:hypothetical protein